eukprot:9153844-Pyramimonas_sp.AAC.1
MGEGNAPHLLLLKDSREGERVNRSPATALDDGGLGRDLSGHIMKIKIRRPPHLRLDRGSVPQDQHYLMGGHLSDVRGPSRELLWACFSACMKSAELGDS